MRLPGSGTRSRPNSSTPAALALLVAAAAVVLPGCAAVYGPYADEEDFLVAFVTVPLDVNMSGEARGDEKALRDDTKRLTINGMVDLNWGRNGVGHIAAAHGLDNVRYADLQIMSFFGIWTQEFVHVYGTSSPEAQAQVEARRAAEYAERHEGHGHVEGEAAELTEDERRAAELAEREARRDAAEAELDEALQDNGDG